MSFASSNVPPANPLAYEGQVVVPYINKTFAPTSSNNQFQVPTIWVDTSSSEGYILTSKPGGVADWQLITGDNASVLEIDADSGTATPTSGVITISGGTTGLTTLASGNELDLTGTLNVSNGGTGKTSYTANGVLYAPTTSTIGQISVSNNGVLISSPLGVPSWLANGTAGYVLTANSLTAPSWQELPASFSSVNTQILTTSGTYTPTTGMIYCFVQCIGGGGGGGGAESTNNQVAGGGGGAAGSYVYGKYSSIEIGSSVAYTIGAGGAGGAAGNNPGTTGGDTIFGSLITATGGNGGPGGGAAVAIGSDGALGDSASTGGVLATAGQGGGSSSGMSITGTGAFVLGGFGGSSFYGGGGTSQALSAASTLSANVDGNAGKGYGSGGGAGISLSYGSAGSASSGGLGMSGVIIVTEFISS